MGDVTKMLEEVENLSISLNFIKECCQYCKCKKICLFSDDEAGCLLRDDPKAWDIGKIMLNVGREIGRREND